MKFYQAAPWKKESSRRLIRPRASVEKILGRSKKYQSNECKDVKAHRILFEKLK
jgi:hypothetical protein